MIDVVKGYEKDRGYDTHPIGMTMQFPVADQTKVNDAAVASRAEWISPGYDDEMFADGRHPMAPDAPPARWFADPPPADGQKVIITDTDHYAPGKADAVVGLDVISPRPPPDPDGFRADRRPSTGP